MNIVTLVPGKISSLKQEIGLYSIPLKDSVPSVKKSVNNRLFFISFLSNCLWFNNKLINLAFQWPSAKIGFE